MNTVELSLLFYQLRDIKGSIAKKKFLEQNKNNEDFKEILKFLFDTRITTGIAKKKMQKVNIKPGTKRRFEDLRDLMNYVIKFNTGTDSVVETIKVYISSQPTETHEFLTGLFTKDFPCGVSAKTLNEVYGDDFIKVHSVMLGHKYSDKMDTVKGEFYLTLKIDDNRATYIPGNSHEEPSIFISRQGQVFEGLTELHQIMSHLPAGFIYDGGLISANDSLIAKDRFRETGSILRKKGEKSGLQFIIYDIIPNYEWYGIKKPTVPYYMRREFVEQYISMYLNKDQQKLVQAVPLYYKGYDKDVIFPLLRQVIIEGHEGLMLNTANGVYEKKRTSSLLKIKEFYTADLRIIGYKEHKHGDKLGAFVVDYKGNPTNIGFGYTDTERLEFWEKRDEMIGKIIEVKYFQESQDQNGKLSIRHGGFERLRDDKDEVSYS